MKKSTLISVIIIFSIFILSAGHQVLADDSCVFMTSAEDLPPNIVLLLDNGAEMEQVMWHADYNKNTNYTPELNAALQTDVVVNGIGNGFYNENGYSIFITGGKYYIVDIPENLDVADHNYRLMADGDGKSPVWTISFGPGEEDKRTVTLPARPSTVVDNEVIDNAEHFRYSKNYLNWIFFSGKYAGNGSDFENRSRFYYAKKAILDVAKLTANQAKFGIYNFTSNSSGASNVQPLGLVVDTPLAIDPENNNLDPSFVNNINNMETVDYSPLAEGLASAGGYYASPSAGILYCEKNFVIVVSPGMSSEDLSTAAGSSPDNLSDFDGDNGVGGISEGQIKEILLDGTEYSDSIPVNINGSTYLDDVACYLYSNDIVDYHNGFQNVMTYTIGFMGNRLSNLFLINTSNNGNGNFNLYDTSDEEYEKYHYEAEDPNNLAATILSAVEDILSITSTFVAPVVPVTRTTSGNQIYMAFFTPSENNLWEGNVIKFGIRPDNVIIDKNGNPATWPNGALRNNALPIWQTKDWAVDDPTRDPNNYILNTSRNIYTYLGFSKELTDGSNSFIDSNDDITLEVLGNPTHTKAEIINYVRGADVFDENADGNTTENRAVISGDVLHSEPLVINYKFPGDTSMTMVYFGSNDGMLHAVVDVDSDGTVKGEEAWGFIPPDQLHRLKYLVEGLSHQYYIDSSPKSYFHDINGDGIVDSNAGDKIVLVCGERKGGTSYFALDITAPRSPKLLWRIDRSDTIAGTLELTNVLSNNFGVFGEEDPIRIWDGTGIWGPEIAARVDGNLIGNKLRYKNGDIPFAVGKFVGNLTTEDYAQWIPTNSSATPFIWGLISSITTAGPDEIIPELGESWSEPQFGLVKTTDVQTDEGTPVVFIGGGYSLDNSAGKAVIALDVFTGNVVKKFTSLTDMDYSIPSSIAVIDEDGNGFVDKVYVGDLGGQLWRFGKFTDSSGNSLGFPSCDENINNWTGQRLFTSDPAYQRKFFYPPSLTLEKGYDLVYFGTGDREDPCNDQTSDGFYCIKDNHNAVTISESDLVDVTDPLAAVPDLDSETSDVDLNYVVDKGWYIQLATGEKVLAENTIFYKTAYFTTFVPNGDPCYPGGTGKIYALEYKTAGAVLDFDNDGDADRSLEIGGGIPSKIVPVITDTGGVDLFVSVGSTIPMIGVDEFDAGVVVVDPLVPPLNFFYLWWRELIEF